MGRHATGSIVEHRTADGRITRSLRVPAHGRRHFIALGDIDRAGAERALRAVLDAVRTGATEHELRKVIDTVRATGRSLRTRRTLDHIDRRGPDECWPWRGPLAPYGRLNHVRVHRVVYERLVGPIPEGHAVHHTCENKACVNPAHLVPMTQAEHLAHHNRTRIQAQIGRQPAERAAHTA